jgi:hypothetical protein
VARAAGSDATGELERMLTAALRHSGRGVQRTKDGELAAAAAAGAEDDGDVDEIWDPSDDWEDIPSPLLAATPPPASTVRSKSEDERVRTLRELDSCDDVWDAADCADDDVSEGALSPGAARERAMAVATDVSRRMTVLTCMENSAPHA